MQHYRIYVLDAHGHIRDAVDAECRDDSHALEVAAQHSKGHGLEVWQRDRFVGRVEHGVQPEGHAS